MVVDMNEHQARLWDSMLTLIDDFQARRLDFYTFVGSLEGALDAAELKDSNLVREWYSHWTPLETVRASRGNDISGIDLTADLTRMRRFLERTKDER